MAKKSKQKQAISRTAQGELARTEQTERAAQQLQSQPPDSESQQPFSVASQGDKTSQNLVQPKELTSEVKCAQDIALLELLDQRPQSFANGDQHGSRDQNDERRVLSIHQERELATNLAFLAGVSDSPNHIMGRANPSRWGHSQGGSEALRSHLWKLTPEMSTAYSTKPRSTLKFNSWLTVRVNMPRAFYRGYWPRAKMRVHSATHLLQFMANTVYQSRIGSCTEHGHFLLDSRMGNYKTV